MEFFLIRYLNYMRRRVSQIKVSKDIRKLEFGNITSFRETGLIIRMHASPKWDRIPKLDRAIGPEE